MSTEAMLEDNLVVNPGSTAFVIAAALAGAVSVVVTNDRRLRVETEAADIDLRAMSADDFAVHLCELMPDDVDEVISTLVDERTKRPVTAEELMEALRAPFPTMAARWSAAATDRGRG